MNTIAINALNSNSGGGKSIRDSYLKLLNEEVLTDSYVVIAKKGEELGFINNPRIKVLGLPALYSRTMAAPFVYRFVLGRLLERIGANVVLNFGDLVVHSRGKQIYLFDWPYALDVHPKVWAGMNIRDWVTRRVKLWLLKRYFHRTDIVIAQTDFIKCRLEKLYSLKDVRVINNAVTLPPDDGEEFADFALPAGIRLLCPSVYYPHKNLEILLDLGYLIKKRKLDYRIVTTVDPNSRAAKKFIGAITVRGLGDVIINIGQVSLTHMRNLYGQCDAMLMPTLLESFSIVYLEAMHHGLPIFTSDLWFAHAICGKAARYFDPFDAENILHVLQESIPDSAASTALIAAGKRQLATFGTWTQNFATYQSLVRELLV